MNPFSEMKLGEHDLKDWDVVIAREQNNGQGRTGRKWHSQKDETLCFSIALPYDLRDFALKMNLISGYAICDVARTYVGDRAKVKWPNDVLIDKKKSSGILLHLYKNCFCMGVGVNISQKEFAPEIKDIANSLHLATGEDFDPLVVLNQILEAFISKLGQMISGNLKIEDVYPEYSQYYGQQTTVHYADGNKYAIIDKGINEDGLLIAEKEDGSEERIISGVDIGLNLNLYT